MRPKKLQKIQHIIQALQFVWRSSKTFTILQLTLLLFQAVLPLINLYILKLLVDNITIQIKNNQINVQEVIFYVALMGGVLLLISIVQIASQYVNTGLSQKVSDYMANLLQRKSVEIDLQYYEDARYHDTLHRAQTQGTFRPVQVLTSLTSLLQHGLSLTAIAGLFVILHWGIALILVVSALPALFIKVYFSGQMYEWQRRTTQMEREAHYLNYLVTDEQYVKEIRVFDASNVFIKKFEQLRKRLYKEKMAIEGRRSWFEIGGKVVEIAATVAIYGFVAYRAVQGNITIGDFVMYFQAFQKGQASLKSTLTSLASLYENRLFLQYIFEFLQIQPKVQNAENAIALPRLQESIQFQNVHFTYPSSQEQVEVLSDINLNLKKGEVIALVGENGSGKTTLIKLLSRLYDVNKGTILFDNQDIRTLDISDVRQKISIIFQDFSKYYLPVSDNIQISDMHRPLDENDVKTAAKNTGADKFIKNLPKQYQNLLGLRFRKGTELSGGQWQKIALSRAFYKDADIIVLDEPTSAIDPLAEYDIFEKFREIAKDKILILITHRLYNLKLANKIIVMDEGKITEQGTHEELVKLNGKYFKMFEKQMN